VLQLDRGITCIGKVSSHEDFAHSSDALPYADGNFVDQHGTAWAADTSLMEAQLDISEMTDAWVRQTKDKLFRNLTATERWLLQMIFRKEFNWVQISAMLQCSTQTARQQYNDVMKYLRGHVGVPEAIAA
jgi:DNA-directed RNA polymerase specialized sigma subunit